MLEIALTGIFLFIVFLGTILFIVFGMAVNNFRLLLQEMFGSCGSCIYLLVILIPVFFFII